MLGKAIIISAMSTGILGSSAVGVEIFTQESPKLFPIGVEISAGPVRIESGSDKGFIVYMEGRTQMAITFVFNDERSLKIKL